MAILPRDEIVRLSLPERLALIAQLSDSLEPQHVPLSRAQLGELESRLASVEQDRQNSMTWDDLKAELEQRCP